SVCQVTCVAYSLCLHYSHPIRTPWSSSTGSTAAGRTNSAGDPGRTDRTPPRPAAGALPPPLPPPLLRNLHNFSTSSEGFDRMDAVDRQPIQALRENGRASYAELGRLVGLSGPSVTDRLNRLAAAGGLPRHPPPVRAGPPPTPSQEPPQLLDLIGRLRSHGRGGQAAHPGPERERPGLLRGAGASRRPVGTQRHRPHQPAGGGRRHHRLPRHRELRLARPR